MKQSHYLYTHMHTLKHCKTYKFHKISQVLCFLLGALSVDEALCLVQAICAGNAGSMGFVLMPQPHSSCSHTAILTHRRLLEDKAVATLDGTFWKTCQDCILDVKFGMCSFLLGMKVCVCVCSPVAVLVLRAFDVHEISLIYNDNVHGGDRRKTSQQCFLICKLCSGSHKFLEPSHCFSLGSCLSEAWLSHRANMGTSPEQRPFVGL